MREFEPDPDHPLMPCPSHWDLVEFLYRKSSTDPADSFIDLVFEREGQRRRLRFFGPQDLVMDRGLPNSDGMIILDVSARQLEGLKVRVGHCDHPDGAPTFWAARVEEMDEVG